MVYTGPISQDLDFILRSGFMMDKSSAELRKDLGLMLTLSWCIFAAFFVLGTLMLALFCKATWIADPVTAPLEVRIQWLQYGVLTLMGSGVAVMTALIFQEIYKTGIPFSKSVTRRFRVIGDILVLTGILMAALVFMISGQYIHDMTAPIVTLVGVLLRFISEIFRYGDALQQEMDQIA